MTLRLSSGLQWVNSVVGHNPLRPDALEDEFDGLVRPGGALPSIKSRLQGPLIQVLSALKASTGAKQLSTKAISEARASYRQAVLTALEDSRND